MAAKPLQHDVTTLPAIERPENEFASFRARNHVSTTVIGNPTLVAMPTVTPAALLPVGIGTRIASYIFSDGIPYVITGDIDGLQPQQLGWKQYVANRPPCALNIGFYATWDLPSRLTSGTCGVCIERSCMKYVSPKFQHCQLEFYWDIPVDHIPGRSIRFTRTFNVTMEDHNTWETYMYTSSNWTTYKLLLGTDEVSRIYEMAAQTNGKRFNYVGYLWNFLLPWMCQCFAYNAAGATYFCAELVATVLKDAGIPCFAHIKPWIATPDDIYNVIVAAGIGVAVPNQFNYIKQPTTLVPQKSTPPQIGSSDVKRHNNTQQTLPHK